MTRATDQDVVASIAEVLHEHRTPARVEGLLQRYGAKIVLAAMRLANREQRREIAALRRQVKRAHADWMKRWDHPGVRYAGEVHLTHKAKPIKLLIYECPRCAVVQAPGEKPPRARRRRCEECGKHWADPPSRLCPGCEAYQEHQR